MKLLLSLMVASSALLIAGGDIMPVQIETKYEKMEVVAAAPTKCYKPNIKKCFKHLNITCTFKSIIMFFIMFFFYNMTYYRSII